MSIAKAGITTTLNTRTTILAAANPAWGRCAPGPWAPAPGQAQHHTLRLLH